MKSIRRLFRFAKPYRKSALLALLMLAGASASELVIPLLVQRIVDRGVAFKDSSLVLSTTLAMLGATLVSSLLVIGNSVLAVKASQSFGADLRSALFRKVQTLSFGNLDDLQTGKLMVRLTSDTNQVQMLLLLSLRLLVRAPVMMIGSAALLVRTGPQLAPIMLILLFVISIMVSLFVRKARPLFLGVQQRLDQLNTVLQENLAGVRVVKAFVRADHEDARFARVNLDLTNQTVKVMRVLSVLMPSMFLVMNLGMVAIVWYGAGQIEVSSLTVGAVMASVNYLLSTTIPLLMIGMMVGMASAAGASADRIVEVLDSKPEVQDRPNAKAPSHIKGRVTFEDVCFSYDGDCGEPVLSDVNLVAEPGETVAILGATGAGKSSFINLIPRFYDVTSGKVTIDGIDVRDMTLKSLREHMGIALQETVLFGGTIRDNIRYGRPDAPDEDVIAAAKAAQAHEFIMAFPDGYDTAIKQRGTNLSGGQKQRIAIARALLVQPRVLILDDSTSSVDVDTEVKIEMALETLMADRTSFVIAQRVSTVLNADKIVVLERGRIAAVGSHSELMESSPIYQEIYQSQLGDGGESYG